MQKKAKTILATMSTLLMIGLFIGCGGRTGEKEHDKAVAAWKKGDLVRARTLFEKSIRKTSGNEKKSIALNQLGLVLWGLGEIDAASDAFEKSCNLAESLNGANLNSSIALFHAGRIDEAEVALNNVLGNDPKNATARTLLGIIEMQKRNWAGATTELTKNIESDPSNPAAQNALALAELHQNRSSEVAIQRLKQTLTTNPDYAPSAFNLAVIYDQWLKKSEQAQEWYKQYLQKAGSDGTHIEAAHQAIARLSGKPIDTQSNPEVAARHIAEGSRLHASKKYAAAVAQYQQAVQADPKQKNAHYNMSLAYYALGNYSETAQACTAAIKIDPKFNDAHYMLALAYVKQEKWNDAEREARFLKQIGDARGSQMLQHISGARKK